MSTDFEINGEFDIDSILPGKVIKSAHKEEILDDGTVSDILGDIDFGCIKCGDTGLMADGKECTENSCMSRRRGNSLIENQSGRYPFRVPDYYKDKVWDINLERDDSRVDKRHKAEYNAICLALDRILDRAKSNTLLKERILITENRYLDLKKWAYTVLKISYDKGITVYPLAILENIDIEKVTDRQLMIINTTRYNFKDNMDKLDHILEIRDMMDLVTIVISEVDERHFKSPLDNEYIKFSLKIGYSE